MQQNELYDIVLKLAGEMNSDNQLRLAQAMSNADAGVSEMIESLQMQRLAEVGHVSVTRVALSLGEIRGELRSRFPAVYKDPDVQQTFVQLRAEIAESNGGGDALSFYRRHNAWLAMVIEKLRYRLK